MVIFLGCLLGLSIAIVSFIITAWCHGGGTIKGTLFELRSFDPMFTTFCIVGCCVLSTAFVSDVVNAHKFKETCSIKGGIVIENPYSGKSMCVNPTMYDAYKVPDYVISLEK